jgi:anti-sigma factor RsiW
MQRITFEQLLDLAENRLSANEAAALRARLAGDPAAQAELQTIMDLITLMRSDDSVDAPDYVINRALRLARRPAEPQAPALLERLVAMLRNDSWQQAATGLRSQQAWPRALLFSAGDYELDLQIVAHGELWQLRGQLLGPEAVGTVLLQGDQGSNSAELNDLGEFVLPPLPSGRYRLLLVQDAREIVIPNLELGPLPTSNS